MNVQNVMETMSQIGVGIDYNLPNLDTWAGEHLIPNQHWPLGANGSSTQNLHRKDKREVQEGDGNNIPLVKPTTPVNKEKLEKWLTGYDTDTVRFLLDGFTFGFKLGFTGENKVRVSKNLRSALENPSVVLGKLQIELKHDRITGPFPAVPLPEFCVSPIGLVPKKQAGRFRIIHHLS